MSRESEKKVGFNSGYNTNSFPPSYQESFHGTNNSGPVIYSNAHQSYDTFPASGPFVQNKGIGSHDNPATFHQRDFYSPQAGFHEQNYAQPQRKKNIFIIIIDSIILSANIVSFQFFL